MVSPVRVRVPPLLFSNYLQGKYKAESIPRHKIRGFDTNPQIHRVGHGVVTTGCHTAAEGYFEMHIATLQVNNYKSFSSSEEIRFEPGFNVIVGQNNVGKTALVEALSLQFRDKPHRSLKTA